MTQNEQSTLFQTLEIKKEKISLASEKIKDAISLLLIMETDLTVHQPSDDTYLRAVQTIVKILKSADSALNS